MRDPKIGDRVARLVVTSGRQVHEEFGSVAQITGSSILVHWTIKRIENGELDQMDRAWSYASSEIIGEWEGHCRDGETCWCIPTKEHHGDTTIIIHNYDEDKS
jgi:hypothetical protein